MSWRRKTIAACIIAKALLEKDLIDRVIVIAPRKEVVKQWADEFQQITERFMGKVTGTDEDFKNMDFDICATWAAIPGLCAGFQQICKNFRTLVICDEHHHASSQASWGKRQTKLYKFSLHSYPVRHTYPFRWRSCRMAGGKSAWENSVAGRR